DLGDVYDGLGELRLAQRRPADALKDFERARALKAHGRGADDVSVVASLGGIGRAWLDLHQPDRALDVLERGYRLAGTTETAPVDRALVAFPLARALWDSGRDRTRARQLAKEALDTLSRSPATRDAARARAWLANHP